MHINLVLNVVGNSSLNTINKMSVVTERESIIEILELYKDLPCLWDPACKIYSNRDARNQALQKILNKWNVIDPNATTSIIKKKLDNMRTAFKREWKKVQESKGTGAGAEEIYVPTLWYYDHLTFLNDRDTLTRCGVDTMGDEDEVPETQINTNVISENVQQRNRRRCQSSLQKKQEELLEKAQSLLVAEDSGPQMYGKAMGSLLQEMTTMQRCIAEKLISEVIFYGKLDKLSLRTTIALNEMYDYTSPPSSAASYNEASGQYTAGPSAGPYSFP